MEEYEKSAALLELENSRRSSQEVGSRSLLNNAAVDWNKISSDKSRSSLIVKWSRNCSICLLSAYAAISQFVATSGDTEIL